MSGHVRIAARLRPRLQAELDDQSVLVHNSLDQQGDNFVSVTNPRDPSQIFKFP